MDGLAEIVQGRSGHAVIAETEIDIVEVELENAILRKGEFDPQRQKRLANLALIGTLVRKQEVLGHLLRDRRRALLTLAAERTLATIARTIPSGSMPACL